MAKHGLFGTPDKQGWFDYEKCPVCGDHWMSCECDREKSDLEKTAEIASHADIITPIAAWMGISPGCLMILGILIMAAMVAIFGD